jgi:hypothetical protein
MDPCGNEHFRDTGLLRQLMYPGPFPLPTKITLKCEDAMKIFSENPFKPPPIRLTGHNLKGWTNEKNRFIRLMRR